MLSVYTWAKAASRSPPQVVAVSKKHPAQAVYHAYNAGLRHFGENYVRKSDLPSAPNTHHPIHRHRRPPHLGSGAPQQGCGSQGTVAQVN